MRVDAGVGGNGCWTLWTMMLVITEMIRMMMVMMMMMMMVIIEVVLADASLARMVMVCDVSALSVEKVRWEQVTLTRLKDKEN